jgi:hypothetical protein
MSYDQNACELWPAGPLYGETICKPTNIGMIERYCNH